MHFALKGDELARAYSEVVISTFVMSFSPGHKLAQYEILEFIGAGGMGAVYRALDTKLGRQVAIKVLPEELAANGERLARFKREAKLLASLNHPNIGAIHGLEQAEETHYLVLEMVEGETLAERIARGPVPVDEAVEIANQIAEALERAHEQGIVHRDLKPANIKLTPDDGVKVLDFGLAKAFGDDGSLPVDDSLSPTITRDGTRDGVILGTAAYMSPEQAKGKRVDKRTDIFAFGAVLYEMLTGTKAFSGEGVSEILASVIKSEPDWSALPSETPSGVIRLLKRCLLKDRKARLRDIGDSRVLVEELATVAPPDAPSFPRWAPLLGAALLLLGGFALGSFLGTDGESSATRAASLPIRARIPMPEGTFLGGHGSPVLAISPDGTTVAV